jgi:hypothetical protein
VKALLFCLALLLVSSKAWADECKGTCVASEDMPAIVTVLKEKKCLQSTTPTFDLDPVTIVIDKDGRVFFSGAEPHPYTLRMKWCSYSTEAKGKVDVVAAVTEPPTWGFRLRPKAYLGYLLVEPLRSEGTAKDGIDAGLQEEIGYWHSFNLNASVGFRSFGAGLGIDIFRSFGAYAGYAMTWDGFRSNPQVSLWFAFW